MRKNQWSFHSFQGKIPLLTGSKDVEQLWKEIQMPDDQEIAGITERLEPASVSLNEHAIEPETMFETQTVPTLDKVKWMKQ